MSAGVHFFIATLRPAIFKDLDLGADDERDDEDQESGTEAHLEHARSDAVNEVAEPDAVEQPGTRQRDEHRHAFDPKWLGAVPGA